MPRPSYFLVIPEKKTGARPKVVRFGSLPGQDDDRSDGDTMETFNLSAEGRRTLSEEMKGYLLSALEQDQYKNRREAAPSLEDLGLDAEPSFSFGTISDTPSIDDASAVIEKSPSSISASELPVRESQPIGGPKYYIATDTKSGKARVIFEAMPSEPCFFQIAEEKGYEVIEYRRSFSFRAFSDALSIDDASAEFVDPVVEKSLSLVSASELPVKESQPIGGPKYYIATDTKSGKARIIFEAIPSEPHFFQIAEEKGYEVIEYCLARKVASREAPPPPCARCLSVPGALCAEMVEVFESDVASQFSNPSSYSYSTSGTFTSP